MHTGETPSNLLDADGSHDSRSPDTPKRVGKRDTTAKASRRSRPPKTLTDGSDETRTISQTIESESSPDETLTATRTANKIAPNETVASANGTDDNNIKDVTNNTASVESAVTGAEMLRIEIQTPDPNLRIIWLSPKTENARPLKTDAHGS
ncbi:MAG: hypothetical protein H0V88_05650 [Pyrinomonadaceae bacterium]|nr:hypothetical protein [Pyrinomonadaceae bacterium]